MSHRATHDNRPTMVLRARWRRWWRLLAPLFVAVVVGAVVIGGGSAAVQQVGPPRGPRALPVNLTDVQIRQLQEQVAELKRRLLLAEEQLAGQQSGYEVVVPERTVAPNRVSPRRSRWPSPVPSWSPAPRPVVSPAAMQVQAAVPVAPSLSVSPSPSVGSATPPLEVSPSPSPTKTKRHPVRGPCE
jgi:hypothetical protein